MWTFETIFYFLQESTFFHDSEQILAEAVENVKFFVFVGTNVTYFRCGCDVLFSLVNRRKENVHFCSFLTLLSDKNKCKVKVKAC